MEYRLMRGLDLLDLWNKAYLTYRTYTRLTAHKASLDSLHLFSTYCTSLDSLHLYSTYCTSLDSLHLLDSLHESAAKRKQPGAELGELAVHHEWPNRKGEDGKDDRTKDEQPVESRKGKRLRLRLG